MEIDLYCFNPHLSNSGSKRRRMSVHGDVDSFSCQPASMHETLLPSLKSSDYFTVPCLSELAARDAIDPGYCSKVPNFTVGRYEFGSVKYLGDTDVRCLDLDKIFKLRRNEVVVYEDENSKPPVGQGLNKPALVTLLVKTNMSREWFNEHFKRVTDKLRVFTERQGAKFLSFNSVSGEWKFLVQHFSKFGLNETDEEDIMMEDESPDDGQDLVEMNGEDDISDFNYVIDSVEPTLLSHSLPAHLRLDPIKMSEMKMIMFSPEEEEEEENFKSKFLHHRQTSGKESSISPLQHSSQLTIPKESPLVIRKTPRALLEYNPGNFGSNSPGSILLAGLEKGVLPRTTQAEGFKLDLKQETPIGNSYSPNIVDAGLFMFRSFRVGWGPNGVLVHSGNPIGSSNIHGSVLSSVVNLEKVAIDKVVRDENNEVKEELVDLCFDSPLNLHKEMDHESMDIEVGRNFKLKLQKVVCNRLNLPEICRSYMEIVEKQLEVSRLSRVSSRVLLMHQVMVWELIKVLFSERHFPRQDDDEEEDMLTDGREASSEVDSEALPLIRRAEFSYWLEQSVSHRVQNEVSSLNESSYLEHIFLLLTGRQVASAVELAASRGDVRLACLLSQAGGSTLNRSDISQQLEIWKVNGMDFNFIEKNRIKLLQLLSGDILGSLLDIEIDWKRFLGLLMWYQLPPDTSLPVIFCSYENLLNAGKAPYPIPIYIDESPNEHPIKQRCDLTYYLMLLHSREEYKSDDALKTMFSSFSSTNDPLDCHAIWHQRVVLEASGTFSSNDLHVLDMGFVSQLLCLGQVHWAIYVVLHIPFREDYPYLHATIIREILFQYCEVWSSNESNQKFIEDLGIPSEWLHEALAIYYNYYGDLEKAMSHFLECGNWQKAHVIFVTSVAHSLFLSGEHEKIWQLAVSMEDHKSEIEDWDLGAGLYISFYLLESSLNEAEDTLEGKKNACADFIGHLNKSLAVWGSRLVVEARMVYSKMGEEICNMLLSDSGEDSTHEIQLSCFETVFKAPVSQDLQTSHLQDALSLFTSYISETAAS